MHGGLRALVVSWSCPKRERPRCRRRGVRGLERGIVRCPASRATARRISRGEANRDDVFVGQELDCAALFGHRALCVDLVDMEDEAGSVTGRGGDFERACQRWVVGGAVRAGVHVEARACGGVDLVDQDRFVRVALAAGAHSEGRTGPRAAAGTRAPWIRSGFVSMPKVAPNPAEARSEPISASIQSTPASNGPQQPPPPRMPTQSAAVGGAS